MKVLVTGASGFLGTNLTEHLKEKHEVVRFSGDVLNLEALQREMQGVEIVFHLAGESSPDRFVNGDEKLGEVHIDGTKNVLEAAKNNNVRKVFVFSTSEIYGDEKTEYREDDKISPKNNYSKIKAEAEKIAISYKEDGLPVIVIRSCHIYGPHQKRNKIIPRFIVNLMHGEKIPVYGTGSNSRSYLHVDDLLSALDVLLEKGEPGIYNIGSEEEIKNIDLAKTLIRKLGKSQELIEFVDNRKDDNKRISLNLDKIKSLGWKPKISFEEGLEKAIHYYQSKYL